MLRRLWHIAQRPWASRVGWYLLFALLLTAFVENRVEVLAPDFGLYNAILSGTHEFSDATISQAMADLVSIAVKRMIFLRTGTWNINNNLTINVPVEIPVGTTIHIASGKTLTFSACPTIHAPGWLAVASPTAKVAVTATGCPTEVHKFATGGDGSQANPWTGWDAVLIWNSGSTSNQLSVHRGIYQYILRCGNYRQTFKVLVPGSYSS